MAADVTLHNTQLFLGIGVGYEVLSSSKVGILPSGGFRLGVSHTDVKEGGGRRKVVKVNPALWAAIDLRSWLHPRVAIYVAPRFEYLFKYEVFDSPISDSGGEVLYEEIFGLSHFRFGATGGFSVLF